jgi:intein/homing endonuclease
MSFRRTANAIISKTAIQFDEWMDELRQQHEGAVSKDYVGRIAKDVLRKCDPKQFLLSHATIVASVDTYAPKGAVTGKRMERGVQIDVRYPDFRVKPACQEIINNNCCPAGTMILMADGTEKPIESVIVGDEVISHTGSVRKVVKTFVHPHRGWIYSIGSRGDHRPLIVTGEHPIWVSRPRKSGAKTVDTGEFGWLSAGLVRENDHVLYPKLRGESNPSGVTPGKAKLLGYYLAEGHLHRQKLHRVRKNVRDLFPDETHNIPVGVEFSLCKDEVDTLAADIVRLMDSEFGAEIKVRQHTISENAIKLYTNYAIEAVQFFKRYAGEHARTKKLDPEVLTWPIELQKLVVQGWLEGDGSVKKTVGGWLTVTTSSVDLHSQMGVLLARLGVVSSTHRTVRSGRKRICDGNGGWIIVNDPTKSCVANVTTINAIEAEKVVIGGFMEDAWRNSKSGRKNRFLEFRTRDDGIANLIKTIEKKWYDGTVFNFETEIDHSYVANRRSVHNSDCWERSLLLSTYRTFIGAPNYLEHIQIPELSKGFIVDAIARDLGNTCYVDILVATDRKHQILVRDIMAGNISALSMGCISLFTCCNRCGNVASDDTQLCPCIMYDGKGSKFADEEGVEHRLGELIGHVSVPNSNTFIEASWVRNPAFKGAVRRNFLNDDMAASVAFSDALTRGEAVMLRRSMDPLPTGIPLAASTRVAEEQDQSQSRGGDEPAFGKPADAPGGQGPDDDGKKKDDGAEDDVPPIGDPAPAAPSGSDKMQGLVDKAQELLLEGIVKGLGDKLAPKPEDVPTATPSLSDSDMNETLLATSSRGPASVAAVAKRFSGNAALIRFYAATRRSILSNRVTGLTPRDLIVFSWIHDTVRSAAMPAALYQAAMNTGPSSDFPSERSYVAACKVRVGRALSAPEQKFFVRIGRIASVPQNV